MARWTSQYHPMPPVVCTRMHDLQDVHPTFNQFCPPVLPKKQSQSIAGLPVFFSSLPVSPSSQDDPEDALMIGIPGGKVNVECSRVFMCKCKQRKDKK